MIYFASDLHLNHDKVFIWEPRGFKSVYEMNDAIINNFNKIVKWDDNLYILGDVMLGDNNAAAQLFKLIPGNKHIILGNHDTTARRTLYETFYKTNVIGYADTFKYNKMNFYLSHYPTMTGNTDDKGLKKCVINLSGHTHSKDKFQYYPQLIYNVAVDAHNNEPVEIEQIINDIKEKFK